MHAAPIMFCNTAGRTKINFKKWRLGTKFCVPSAILIIIKAYPPYQFQADLIWCNGTFKLRQPLNYSAISYIQLVAIWKKLLMRELKFIAP